MSRKSLLISNLNKSLAEYEDQCRLYAKIITRTSGPHARYKSSPEAIKTYEGWMEETLSAMRDIKHEIFLITTDAPAEDWDPSKWTFDYISSSEDTAPSPAAEDDEAPVTVPAVEQTAVHPDPALAEVIAPDPALAEVAALDPDPAAEVAAGDEVVPPAPVLTAMEVESSGSEEEIRRKEDGYADNVTVTENTEEREESYAPAFNEFSLDEIPVPKVKGYVSTKTPAFTSDSIVKEPAEYEPRSDMMEVGKVSTQYVGKVNPKPNKKAKYVGNGRKKRKKRNPGKNPIQGERKIPKMKKRKKRIRMTRIPRKKLKDGRFRFSFQIQGSSGKPAWRPSVPIYSSSIAANIRKRNYQQLQLSSLASHASLQLPLAVFTPLRKVLQRSRLLTLWNNFRQKSLRLLLQPVGGDTTKGKVQIEAIAQDVLCIKSEDIIKIVARIPHFHADQRGNVVSSMEPFRVN